MSDETETPPEATDATIGETARRLGGRLRSSLLARFLVVGLLVLAMQIPLAMVEDIVEERGARDGAVRREIAKQWGATQVLRGPVLAVPFREKLVSQKKVYDDIGRLRDVGEISHRERTALVLPDMLDLDIQLTTERRRRGLFEVLVYGANVGMLARFSRPDIATLSPEEVEVDWDKAFIAIGLSDPHAIREISHPSWQGRARPLAPNTDIAPLLQAGFHIPLDGWSEESGADLKLNFAANGSGGFRFAPLGESTVVRMRSDWPHPSFQGAALPASHRIGASGFEAEWRIPALARSYPQLWVQPERRDLDEVMAGVDLAEPVLLYSKLTRATKYGVLYVALTFLTFLVFELAVGARLHLLQFGLIGLALSLFYLTLLSLAEHVAFAKAYLTASGVIVGMVTLYAWAALRRLVRAVVVGLALAALYGVLYTLLQMEDFALLAGTALLVLVLAVLMLATRKLGSTADEAGPPSAAATPEPVPST